MNNSHCTYMQWGRQHGLKTAYSGKNTSCSCIKRHLTASTMNPTNVAKDSFLSSRSIEAINGLQLRPRYLFKQCIV